MTIVAHSRSFVIGVDTHARTHTCAVIDGAGRLLGCEQFPTSAAGIGRAIGWVGRRTGGDAATLWVIECVATYGAKLTRQVTEAGYRVVEAPNLNARTRRGAGKSDALDAQAIAAATLPLEESQLRQPRADDGERAALRTLTAAREQMTRERTVNINALTALLRVHELGIDARSQLAASHIRQVSRWRTRPEPLALTIAREEATRLACRIIDLDTALKANQARMTSLIESTPAAPLLDINGIGPVTAAIVITAWSHPGRIRNEAAFAALAGVNPVPASSGNTIRHRLNRRGDRRLNAALHIAVATRMTHDPQTRAYVNKRLAEGHTKREIRRCLKRYLARHLYRTLNSFYPKPASPNPPKST